MATFPGSAAYWQKRYDAGGNSGAGSYGRLADFKAEFLNAFVTANGIGSVIEFGCGDGNQLALAAYPNYLGLDISQAAVELCRAKFENVPSWRFEHLREYAAERAELAVSLDVIYHLVEDEVFHEHMTRLFDAGERFVIVYASDQDSVAGHNHVRHRRFTPWVQAARPDFRLRHVESNRFPWSQKPPHAPSADYSPSSFFVFERRSEARD